MSTMISSKQMETKLYNLVSALADNFGFDADEAFEFARWETDVDHVGEILKVVDSTSKPVAPKKDEPKKEEAAKDDSAEKISTYRKNIDLWQRKLDEGSVKDADKQREKIEKEQKKLDKLLTLLKKAPAPAAKVEAKKPEPKVEAKKEKRIKRFSPVMASQLKTALEGVKMEMSDPLKKEFQQYIEDLTDDDFRKESMADHMRAFAKLKAPVEKARAEKAAEDTSDEEVDNGAGVGFHLMKKDDSDMEESDEEVKMEPTATVVDVTLKELQEISMTATIDPPGTFWDADNGRFVKGPDADDDEDFEETTFDGVKYVVGEKTGRIYEARDTGDVFAGFKGVGKFKKMTI